MITQEQIKKLNCGLIKCPAQHAYRQMPELAKLFESCPVDLEKYTVDVKVHMLMPGQWPCIPNWHGDAIPRDADGELLPEERDASKVMWLWLSGPPLTEFKDGRTVEPQKWISFTQFDLHRGTMSDDFQWRLFVRMMPNELVVRPRLWENSARIHTQVYLDAGGFNW